MYKKIAVGAMLALASVGYCQSVDNYRNNNLTFTNSFTKKTKEKEPLKIIIDIALKQLQVKSLDNIENYNIDKISHKNAQYMYEKLQGALLEVKKKLDSKITFRSKTLYKNRLYNLQEESSIIYKLSNLYGKKINNDSIATETSTLMQEISKRIGIEFKSTKNQIPTDEDDRKTTFEVFVNF